MPAPTLESFSAELYKHVAPMAWDDANQGYALAYFCKAIGQLFQVVEDLSRDQVLPGGKVAPGWSQALDAARCPAYALPWLAQFVGATVDQRLSETNQRQQLEQVNNWKRGTLAAIQAAPLPYLTGTKNVVVRERYNALLGVPDPYYFEVITLFDETPDAVPSFWGPVGNFVRNPSFEVDLNHLNAFGGAGVTGYGTTRVAGGRDRGFAAQLSATGGVANSYMAALSSVTALGVLTTDAMPVTPGQSVYGGVSVKTTAQASGTLACQESEIAFYDSSGASLGSLGGNASAYVVVPVLNQWNDLTVNAVAPAGAAWAVLRANIGTGAPGGTGIPNGVVNTTLVDKMWLSNKNTGYIDGSEIGYVWQGTADESFTLVPNQWTSPSVLAALTAQKPAGLVMTYVVLDGQDWQAVKNNYATFQDVKNAYVTLAGLRAAIPGT